MPRLASTAQQRTCPERCHHATAFHAGGSIAQGKASARAASRRTPTSSRAGGGSLHTGWPGRCPRQGQRFVLHLAAHLQRRAPIQCDATTLQLIMPAEHLCSCHVPQNIDLMLRWRWNSTRQPTEALPKAGQILMLHLAAQQLQSIAPIQCYATPLQRIVALTALTARHQFASTSPTTGQGHKQRRPGCEEPTKTTTLACHPIRPQPVAQAVPPCPREQPKALTSACPPTTTSQTLKQCRPGR